MLSSISRADLTSGSCIIHRSANWTDVTPTSGGVVLTETPNGLTPGTLYRWRARVLYAPFSIAEAGITEPPNPAHGPLAAAVGAGERGGYSGCAGAACGAGSGCRDCVAWDS